MTAPRCQALAQVAEIATVLARYQELRCIPMVEYTDDGQLRIELVICTDTVPDGLQALSLHDDLKYVAALAQLRMLAETFNIDPDQLEALLPQPSKAMLAPLPPQETEAP